MMIVDDDDDDDCFFSFSTLFDNPFSLLPDGIFDDMKSDAKV